MKILSVGSEAKGRTPIYDFDVRTTGLYLGTLCMLLNNPEDVPRNENGQIQPLQHLDIKTHQIKQIEYTIEEVAQAVQILKSVGEVDKKLTTIWDEQHNNPISLTDDGYTALTSRKYLKRYYKGIKKETIYNSTIKTNKKQSLFNAILAVSAAITLFVTIFQEFSKQNISAQKQQEYLQPIKNSIEHLEVYQEQTSMALNHISVSIDTANIILKSKK